MFANPPVEEHWRVHLTGQTALRIAAGYALTIVRAAWHAATTDG